MADFTNYPFNAPDHRATTARILVVDADTSVGDMIRDNFAAEGYHVESCLSGDAT